MKIVLVSIFAPDTNYTRDLATYMKSSYPEDKMTLCGPREEDNSDSPIVIDSIWHKNFLFAFDIIKYIFNKKPDIVHFQHEVKMYGGLFTALLFPWMILFLRLFGYKVIVTIHAVVSPQQINKVFLKSFGKNPSYFNKKIARIFFNYIYQLICRFSCKTIVHTESFRETLINDYHINAKKVIFLPHGIRIIKQEKDLSKNSLDILNRFPVLRNKKIILVFGWFSPRKGYELLIESFIWLHKQHDFAAKWTLVFAGGVKPEFEEYRKKIIDFIKQNNAQNYIVTTGEVSGGEIDELYRLAEIIAVPAIFGISASGSLSLALAYKKPLVGSDVVTNKEELETLKAGELYQNGNIESCVRALHKLMASEELRKRFKNNIKKKAFSRNWTTIAKKHYRTYINILG